MKLLFIDTCNPKPYCPLVSKTEALGGTEATVIRIAEGLAQYFGHDVTVAQNRPDNVKAHAHYKRLTPKIWSDRYDRVIVLRDPSKLVVARMMTRAPLVLWCHDMPSDQHRLAALEALSVKHTVLAVSDHHKTRLIEATKPLYGPMPMPAFHRIYNPLGSDVRKSGTTYDPHKLTFISSPHKGLNHTMHLFTKLLEFNPAFKLYIANPGYMPDAAIPYASVVNLGQLPHHELMKHVEESLCLFYPNTVFPETFGLVMAEANALGTPVLTHPLGAAREVLVNAPSQLTDCHSVKSVVDKVLYWSEVERPLVSSNPLFHIDNILPQWNLFLEGLA